MSNFLRKNSKLVKGLVDNVVGFDFINYLCDHKKDVILDTEHRIDLQGIEDGNINYSSEKIMNDLMAFIKLITDRKIYSSVWDSSSKFPNQTVYYYRTGCNYGGFVKDANIILNQPLQDLFNDFNNRK